MRSVSELEGVINARKRDVVDEVYDAIGYAMKNDDHYEGYRKALDAITRIIED